MVFSILCGVVALICFLAFCFYLVLDWFSEMQHVQRSERTRLYHAACKAQADREQLLLDELRFERWKAEKLARGEAVTIKAPAGYQRPQNTITTRPIFDSSKVW